MVESNPKQSPEELQYLYQIYQSQYNNLGQEIGTRLDVLRQLDGAQKALEEMDAIKGKNTLIPVGADVYIDGKVNAGKTVIVGIGAKYLVEKPIDDAKGYVSKAMEKETDYINKLAKSRKEVEASLMDISYKLQELSR